MRSLILALFLSIAPIIVEAGAYLGRSGVGEVEGFVYDAVTSSVLMGVRIEAPGRLPIYSDHHGFFKIEDLPVGSNHLVFRKRGYVPQEEIFMVYEDEKTYLAVFMWPVVEYIPPPSYLPPPYIWPYWYPPPPPEYHRWSGPALDWWYYHCYPSLAWSEYWRDFWKRYYKD
jgi:hypothetical protein